MKHTRLLLTLSSCLTIIGLSSCKEDNFNITEADWKSAIERIVNVTTDYSALNYVATGSIYSKHQLITKQETQILEQNVSSIEVNGPCEKMVGTHIKDSNDVEMLSCSEIIGHTYFIYNKPSTSTPYGRYADTPLRDYTASQLFIDLYNYMNLFEFNKKNKSFTIDYSYGENYYKATIHFNENKVINDIDVDYHINYSKKSLTQDLTVKGKLNYSYGNATVNKEYIENQDNFKELLKEESMILNDSNEYKFKTPRYSMLKKIDIYSNDETNTKQCLNSYYSTEDKELAGFDGLFRIDKNNELYVYKDDKLLARGTKEDPKDYYLDNYIEKDKGYSQIVLSEEIKNSHIEVINYTNISSYYGLGYVLKFENITNI